MSLPEKHFYQFGPFCLDPVKRRLLRDGEVVKLTPKAFDTLLALVRERGKTIEKDDLLNQVWAGVAVEENNLVGSSRVDLQACKLEYSIVSPK